MRKGDLSILPDNGSVEKRFSARPLTADEEWSKYPSGYRRLATRIIQTTMVFQAAVGDERDLQRVIEQNKVTKPQRRSQRSALRRAIDEAFDRQPKRRKVLPKVKNEQLPQQYIDGLQM